MQGGYRRSKPAQWYSEYCISCCSHKLWFSKEVKSTPCDDKTKVRAQWIQFPQKGLKQQKLVIKIARQKVIFLVVFKHCVFGFGFGFGQVVFNDFPKQIRFQGIILSISNQKSFFADLRENIA